MPRYHLDVEEPPTWEPLKRLARLCRQRLELPPLQPEEFMYMGRLVSPDRPPIHAYKHIDTRRYLYIDDLGHTFVVTRSTWIERTRDLIVECRPLRDLTSALTPIFDLHPAATPRQAT